MAASDSYTSSSTAASGPANAESPSAIRPNCSWAVGPGTRLVVASAPAFTMGFMVRSALSSIPITESKGRPVLLTPSLRRASSGPMASHTRANTKSLEMLWIVNSRSLSPTAKSRPCTPATHTPKASGDALASAGM